jgi:DNA-binding NtrC family response regulator
MHQPWPGNVRELENVLLRQFLLSDQAVLTIGQKSETKVVAGQQEETVSMEPGDMGTSLKFQHAKLETIHNFEQHYLHKLLRLTEGNVSAAARISGKERRALGKLLKKYNIDRNGFQSATGHG